MLESKSKPKQCVHHWIIDFPDGPTSFGKCKLCGATAEFTNDLQSVLDTRKQSSEGDHAHIEESWEEALPGNQLEV
jgi:hypothetical protein